MAYRIARTEIESATLANSFLWCNLTVYHLISGDEGYDEGKYSYLNLS